LIRFLTFLQVKAQARQENGRLIIG
jgi:hypothetical protein